MTTQRKVGCAAMPDGSHSEKHSVIDRPWARRSCLWLGMGLAIAGWGRAPSIAEDPPTEVAPQPAVDPRAWGGDHVGQAFPDYMTGDECLFCHRTIGSTWGENQHQTTLRLATTDDPAMVALRQSAAGAAVAERVQYLLGSGQVTRFLKQGRGYGQLELLAASVRQSVAAGTHEKLTQLSGGYQWNAEIFGQRCAGCHATAVDTRSQTFAAVSLDCFTCHGEVVPAHTKDSARVLLSSKNRSPREVVSICGQCHLRGGRSQSTRRPYPNTFVAGDNLLRDFQLDFSVASLQKLPTREQHIYHNVWDVSSGRKTQLHCLSCHDVHASSTQRHRNLQRTTLCATCHQKHRHALLKGARTQPRTTKHNRVCDY